MTRRGVFGSLLGLVFLVNLARVVFAPLLAPIGADFGVQEGALGAVATAAWLGSALPRLPTGVLLTRVGRDRVVALAGGMLAVAAAGTAQAGSPLAVTVGAFAMGLSSGVYFIAANPLVSELFPDRVGTVIGVHGMASQLAAVAATPLVVAAVAVGNWTTAMEVIAVVAAVSTVAFVAVARRSALPAAGQRDRNFLGAARAQWRVVLTAVAVVGAVSFVWNGLFNFYDLFLQAQGLPTTQSRTLLTVVFAAGVPAFLISGRLADRLPVVSYMLALVGAFVAIVLVLTRIEGFLAFAVASVALGYVVHSIFPAIDTYLLGSLPDQHRASAYALYSATMMIVQAGGSVTLGTLVEGGFAYDDVLGTAAAGLAVGLAVLVVMHRAEWLPAGARV